MRNTSFARDGATAFRNKAGTLGASTPDALPTRISSLVRLLPSSRDASPYPGNVATVGSYFPRPDWTTSSRSQQFSLCVSQPHFPSHLDHPPRDPRNNGAWTVRLSVFVVTRKPHCPILRTIGWFKQQVSILFLSNQRPLSYLQYQPLLEQTRWNSDGFAPAFLIGRRPTTPPNPLFLPSLLRNPLSLLPIPSPSGIPCR